jgi:hypothetical protein
MRIPSMGGGDAALGEIAGRKMVPQRGPKGTLISKLTLCATDKKNRYRSIEHTVSQTAQSL